MDSPNNGINPQMPGPVPTSQMPPLQKHSSNTGALVGAVIVIIILAIGALYLWGAKLNENNANPPPLILSNDTASAAGADQTSDASAGLPPQQSSDDAATINADLQAMNVDQMNTQTSNDVNAFGSSTQ